MDAEGVPLTIRGEQGSHMFEMLRIAIKHEAKIPLR